jgi:deoxyribose-phosphate aldolase
MAARIDHGLLRPELLMVDVVAGCAIALEHHTVSVCCRPLDIATCARELAGTDVEVGTVIGFPHGAHHTDTKVDEARRALADGAVELDVVIAIGRLRDGDATYVEAEIRAIVGAAEGRIVKVILENHFLTDDEKRLGCRIAESAGADYVKTSTGYAPTSATVADVALMRAAVSPHVKVKAAGGIRTLADALAMVAAGADRLGTSSTAAILAPLS